MCDFEFSFQSLVERAGVKSTDRWKHFLQTLVKAGFGFLLPNDGLVDEFLQSAEVNVCNGSKCYVPDMLACAYQNAASVMKLRATKEIQIDVCTEVLKTQQVLPIQRVGWHMPLQRLRKLWVASHD